MASTIKVFVRSFVPSFVRSFISSIIPLIGPSVVLFLLFARSFYSGYQHERDRKNRKRDERVSVRGTMAGPYSGIGTNIFALSRNEQSFTRYHPTLVFCEVVWRGNSFNGSTFFIICTQRWSYWSVTRGVNPLCIDKQIGSSSRVYIFCALLERSK